MVRSGHAAGNPSDNEGTHHMREHYQPKPVRRTDDALDVLVAIAIGVALAVLGLAYFDVLWP